MIQVIYDGLVAGSFYSLVTLGFVIIFRVSGVFNFAHPASMFIGAEVFAVISTDGTVIRFVIGIVAALVVCAIVGAASYAGLMSYVAGRPHYAQMMVTFALT